MPIENTRFKASKSGFRKAVPFFLITTLAGQAIMYLPACDAVGIPLISSKHDDLSLPANEKLLSGTGPNTSDQSVNPNAGNNSPADLSPLKLQDQAEVNNSASGSSDDAANGAVLKSSVSTTDYVPHDGNPQVLQSESINNKKKRHNKNNKKDIEKESLSEQAAAVKVGPLPLLQSEDETQKKAETISDAEKEQISDLWEATLTRNPDIQFVVQKLQPTSNPAHMVNILARMVSTAAFGGLGAMSMMSPNMGTFAAASMGGSMMQTALGISQRQSDKHAKLTNEEQTIMYNMVRTTCDKLVSCYRLYKKYWNSLTRASNDLQDLQAMVAEARSGQDAAKQLEMEYTLRKQQRDLDAIADDLRGQRQGLIDIAGPDAVGKLDKQLFAEYNKLEAHDQQVNQQPFPTKDQPESASKTNADLAQSNSTIKNIDSADNLTASSKGKSQTASTTLCPQS